MTSIAAIRFEIVCVNDGSRDDTLDRLIRISTAERRVRVIDLTRNFGKKRRSRPASTKRSATR